MSSEDRKLLNAIERLATAVEKQNQMAIASEAEYGDKYVAAAILSINPESVRSYRENWIRGIHFVQLNGDRGDYRYNKELIKDWLANRSDPIAHQQAIEVWNSRRLCNQSVRSRRRAS